VKIILASGSPRRAEILRNAGFEFEVRTADIDETIQPDESVSVYVQRLALSKARKIAGDLLGTRGYEDAIVVGADTAVSLDDEIMGKPNSDEDARGMLARLRGKVHEVHTGLALVQRHEPKQQVLEEVTRVYFLPLSNQEIVEYVATGEPVDKAGAYGIQGLGSRFVRRIEGCYFNVMGLPIARLYELLRDTPTVSRRTL
jgi:septum formation protein